MVRTLIIVLALSSLAYAQGETRTPNLNLKPGNQAYENDNWYRLDEAMGGFMAAPPYNPANAGKVYDRGGAVVNVQNAIFGAVGDGATDDTTALQRALDRCGAVAGVVYAPRGTYLTSGVSVPSGCTFMGAGIGATVLKLTTGVAGGNNVVSVGSAASYVTDASVRDLTIDGSKASYASSVHISGVRVAGSRITVERVYVHDVTAGCIGVGLGTGTMGDVIIRDNWCHNPASTSGGANFWGGYFIVHGDRVTFENNVHTQDDSMSGYGFDCEPNAGQSVDHLAVRGGFLQAKIKIAGVSGSNTTDHVRVSDVTVVATGQSGGGQGLVLDDVTDVVLANLYVEGPTDTSTGNTVSIADANNVQMLGGTYMHRAGASRSRLKLDTVTTMIVDGSYWDIPSGNAPVIEELNAVSNFQWLAGLVNGAGGGFYHTKLAGSTPYLRLTQTAQTFAQLPTLVRAGSEILCSDCVRTTPCAGGSSGSTTIARRVGSAWNCAQPGELGPAPSVETIAAGGVVTANACGGIKRISAAGAVTTDTTNTFTAPGVTNAGCIMSVCNASTNQITLDQNALFTTASGSDVVLTDADDCVTVGSDGSKWRQLSAVLAGS